MISTEKTLSIVKIAKTLSFLKNLGIIRLIFKTNLNFKIKKAMNITPQPDPMTIRLFTNSE
jgi:hypothetical protein